ncbi:MAG: hypothetical protein WA733_10360 [Methylocystis sp.]
MAELTEDVFSTAEFAGDGWHNFLESNFSEVLQMLVDNDAAWELVEFTSISNVALLLIEKLPSFVGGYRLIRYDDNEAGQQRGALFALGHRYIFSGDSPERVAEREDFLAALEASLNRDCERKTTARVARV